METPKPQTGTWTLTAPDGRTWEASSPLHCCGAEQRERVPADVALARILKAATQTPDEVDAERYRWLRKNPQWLGWEHDFRPDEVDRELDAAMR